MKAKQIERKREFCKHIKAPDFSCSHYFVKMSQERENVSLYVSDNVNLEFENDISLFFINKNFQMTTFNVLVFAINNITVLIVNIMVLIWLQV